MSSGAIATGPTYARSVIDVLPNDSLPVVGERRLAVRVTPDALRHVRAGHPWVFGDSVVSVSHDGAVGDLAVIFDSDRRFAAIGLYDPASPIRIRIVHVGKPANVNRSFWADAISAAVKIRQPLLDAEYGGQPAYRLINGENDAMPGLVVDRYADTLVVKLYSPVWFPHLDDVVAALAEVTTADSVVLVAPLGFLWWTTGLI